MSSPFMKRLADVEAEVARLRNEVATLSRRIGHVDLATVVGRLAERVSALDGMHVNATVSATPEADRLFGKVAQSLADGADSDAPSGWDSDGGRPVDPTPSAIVGDEVVTEKVISTIPPPSERGTDTDFDD